MQRPTTDSSETRPQAHPGTESDILSIRKIRKHYAGVKAVDGVDLSVRKGEFLTLLGPSGSGKTTLLMMIAGFVDPSEGDIYFHDKRITALPPEKRNLGVVFQSYALFPHLTVAENVAFPLRIRKFDKGTVEQKVGSALDLVQLAGLAHRKPKELSGGQQQRVALARALSYSPELLLLDEPLGALDRKLRADVQVELKQLHLRVAKTFVYVTHDQEEALSMSDRIAIFRDGRIEQVGTSRELYERPVNRFVADFLGSSNFIHGTVYARRQAAVTVGIGPWRIEQAIQPEDNVLPGDRLLIGIRPERITVNLTGDAPSLNCIAGTISGWSYVGTSLRITADADGIGKFHSVVPAWNAPIEPRNGQQVFFAWRPDAGVIVADDTR